MSRLFYYFKNYYLQYTLKESHLFKRQTAPIIICFSTLSLLDRFSIVIYQCTDNKRLHVSTLIVRQLSPAGFSILLRDQPHFTSTILRIRTNRNKRSFSPSHRLPFRHCFISIMSKEQAQSIPQTANNAILIFSSL